jgi:hypothetical protein
MKVRYVPAPQAALDLVHIGAISGSKATLQWQVVLKKSFEKRLFFGENVGRWTLAQEFDG